MKKLSLTICSTTLSLCLLAGVALADKNKKNTIEGAWEVEVTARVATSDCTSGEPVPFGPNPFSALQTYHKGGTMSDYEARIPPSNRSAAHGVWQKAGKNQYVSHFVALNFDDNGLISGKTDISSDIALTGGGSTFSAVSRAKIIDISGNVLDICLTMEGVRMPL